MNNQLLQTILVVRAGQLQAANLVCLLVAFIARRRLTTKKRAKLQRRYVQEEISHDLSNDDDDIQGVIITPSSSEQSSNVTKHKSKKRKLEQEDEALISKLMNCLDSVTNAILEGNKVLDKICHREYTGEEIYKELEQMGLESDDIPKALIYLAAHQAEARALFTCPHHIRMDILKAMMGAGN